MHLLFWWKEKRESIVRVATNLHKTDTFSMWLFVRVLTYFLDSAIEEEAKRKKEKTLGEHQAICSHLYECFYFSFAVVQFAFISFICVIVLITIFRFTAPRYATLGTVLISENVLLLLLLLLSRIASVFMFPVVVSKTLKTLFFCYNSEKVNQLFDILQFEGKKNDGQF